MAHGDTKIEISAVVEVKCGLCLGKGEYSWSLFKCPYCEHEYSLAESMKALSLKCPECEDFIPDKDCDTHQIGSKPAQCPTCSGSSKWRKRLVGYVMVNSWGLSGGQTRFRVWGKREPPRGMVDVEYSPAEALESGDLAQWVVDEYKAGTLPECFMQSDENPDGLRLTEENYD